MKFGIIGYGKFGKLWEKCLMPFGQVFVYDKFDNSRNSKARYKQVMNVDFLFLLVPISSLKECCLQIRDDLKPETLVVDACSVKIQPIAILKRYLRKTQAVLPTHPLFGPDTYKCVGLKAQKIVICPAINNFARNKFSNQQNQLIDVFKKMGLKVIFSSAREHDKMMAYSQALVHFVARGLKPLKLENFEISTRNYSLLYELTKIVQNDTEQLFFDMERLNPFAKKLRNEFLTSIYDLEQKIAVPAEANLSYLRKEIEILDAQIIKNIALRFELVKRIGRLKNVQNLDIKDSSRELSLSKIHKAASQRMSIDPELILAIFDLIIAESRKIQHKN